MDGGGSATLQERATSARPRQCPVCAATLPCAPLCYSSFARGAAQRGDGVPRTALWRCPACELVFRAEALSAAEAARYYDEAPYVAREHAEEMRCVKGGMLAEVARRTVASFPATGRRRVAVDVGCSYGHLGQEFQAAGWDAIGVDVAPSVVEHHRLYGTFPVYPTLDTEQIPDGGVDAITLIDVLYYLPDPLALLRVMRRKLATPGVVVLRVPHRTPYITWASRLQRLVSRDLVARVECDHATYWTARTVETAASIAGFDGIRIIRREKGYGYDLPRRAFHTATQLCAEATGGRLDLATVFHAELWKGRPVAPRDADGPIRRPRWEPRPTISHATLAQRLERALRQGEIQVRPLGVAPTFAASGTDACRP
jgi:SAM-dependent methyltransferase